MSEEAVTVRFYVEGMWECRQMTDSAGWNLFLDLWRLYGSRLPVRLEEEEDRSRLRVE